jgi:hypothetical protein
MSERSKLSYPGGFVPLAAVASRLDDLDPSCVFCFSIGDERSWLHLSSNRVVCSRCLKDPYAGHDDDAESHEGDEGRQAAERLIALLEEEARPVIF